MKEEIQKIIKEIIEKAGVSAEEVSFSCEGDRQDLWCRIKTEDSRFFLGRGADGLKALNYLARRMAEKALLGDAGRLENRIIIDINDYQRRQIENLKTMAHMLSERAKFFKSSVEADPMAADERKIIHEFLAGRPNIKTESAGVEPKRRVVIKYVE